MKYFGTYFKNIFSFKSTWFLCAISFFAVMMAFMRFFVTGYTFYLFMITNLFFAFIPWLISSVLKLFEIKNRFVYAMLIFLWIIFFPNAPYMFTDLIHLGKNRAAPLWYDLIMLLTFGFTGLYYSFESLFVMEQKLKNKISELKPKLFSKHFAINFIRIIFIYITCFGIYLGRFLRWNSWDLLSHFFGVMNDVCRMVFLPFDYPGAWGFTILGGTLLNFLYMFYVLREKQ